MSMYMVADCIYQNFADYSINSLANSQAIFFCVKILGSVQEEKKKMRVKEANNRKIKNQSGEQKKEKKRI